MAASVKISGRKKSKNSSSGSPAKSAEKEQSKFCKQEKARIRNDKAKSAGARLGGFLRSSLSFHRSKPGSKSKPEGTSAAVNDGTKEPSLIPDESSTKTIRSARSTHSTKSSRNTNNDGSCLDQSIRSSISNLSDSPSGKSRRSSRGHDQGNDVLHLSIQSTSFRRSHKSERSLLSLDDRDIELSDDDFEQHSKATPSKAHLEAREKLLLESQQAIERKQKHALIRSQSMYMISTKNSSSHSDGLAALSHTSGSKPKPFHHSRSLSLTPSLEASVHSKEHTECGPKIMSSATKNNMSLHKQQSKKSLVQSYSECKAPLPSCSTCVPSRPRQFFDKTISKSEHGVRPSKSEKTVETQSRSCSPSKRSLIRIRSMSKEKRNIPAKTPSICKPFTLSGKSDPNNALDWHSAIVNHDWETVQNMLQSFDYTMYKDNRQSAKRSPLLQVNPYGRTVLHLSCVEHMPQKLLLRLLFVERNAAGVKDKDGRFALHLALINNMGNDVLDRLIRAHPKSLGTPDNLNKTPLQYAILKANYHRTTNFPEMDFDGLWNSPTTRRKKISQEQQRRAWGSVAFILETMISRRKALSLTCERTLLLESAQFSAPPEVVTSLVTVGGKALLSDANMSKDLLEIVFSFQYTIPVTRRIIKVTSKVLPKAFMLNVIRTGLDDHYRRGCINIPREGTGDTSFAKELLQYYRSKLPAKGPSLSAACQEWWDKLRFLIAYSSCRFKDDTDEIVLHAALSNPKSLPSLIEFLCRLLPTARYEIDVTSKGLPLHLACMYWHPPVSNQDIPEYIRVLNLLMAGDVRLVQSLCRRRLSLHHALLTKKPAPLIQTLLSLDPKTVVVPDPVTRLFPFQLAALALPPDQSISSTDYPSCKSDDLEQIDLVYNLLRSNPFPMSILLGCQVEDMSPLTRHSLRGLYDWDLSGWNLNVERTDLFRVAIRRGKIFGDLKPWWSILKTLIWRAANDIIDETGHNPMCKTPQNCNFLLHAALWNGSQIPPIIIELIMEVYPASVFTKQPGTNLFPLQIAAKSSSYRHFAFESMVSMNSALEMLSLLDGETVKMKAANGRLPLHDAVCSGKAWPELLPLIEMAPESPLIKDPTSGLFPFQAAACNDSFIPRPEILRAGHSGSQWAEASPRENARTIADLCEKYECEKLSTIYEVLRAAPVALETVSSSNFK